MENIIQYTWQQAVEDGILAPVLQHRWPELTYGKPILMTAAIAESISVAGVMEIWNAYVIWRQTKMEKLPPAEQMFVTKMNSKDVWVIDDGATFTVLYPEDY